MKVSLRALLLAVAMTTPAWLSASADEGLAIRFIGGEAYDTAASQVSYNNMEVALGGGCAAPTGCAAAAPSCGAAAGPSCGADAACGCDNGCDNGCDDCCDFDFGPFLPCKRWAVFAGAPIMVRQNFHDGLVHANPAPAASADDVLVGPSPGVYSGFQGNIIKYRDSGRDIDFGFMFLGANPTAADVLFQPAFLPPITDLGSASAIVSNYQSTLISVEGNLRLRSSDWFSWIAGVRYIGLSENLMFLAVGTNGTATGLARANNNLVGGQLGGSAILAAHGRWTINGQFRGGIYYNDADVTAAGFLGLSPVFATADSNPWAVEADGQLTASYWLSDHFALRFGYQVMWLDRVALAPSQFGALTGPTSLDVDDTSTPFWHGALVQGEVVW